MLCCKSTIPSDTRMNPVSTEREVEIHLLQPFFLCLIPKKCTFFFGERGCIRSEAIFAGMTLCVGKVQGLTWLRRHKTELSTLLKQFFSPSEKQTNQESTNCIIFDNFFVFLLLFFMQYKKTHPSLLRSDFVRCVVMFLWYHQPSSVLYVCYVVFYAIITFFFSASKRFPLGQVVSGSVFVVIKKISPQNILLHTLRNKQKKKKKSQRQGSS